MVFPCPCTVESLQIPEQSWHPTLPELCWSPVDAACPWVCFCFFQGSFNIKFKLHCTDLDHAFPLPCLSEPRQAEVLWLQGQPSPHILQHPPKTSELQWFFLLKCGASNLPRSSHNFTQQVLNLECLCSASLPTVLWSPCAQQMNTRPCIDGDTSEPPAFLQHIARGHRSQLQTTKMRIISKKKM